MSNVQMTGMIKENMAELVTKLYCKKAGKNLEDGSFQVEKQFKFMLETNQLSEHPKFRGRSEEKERKLIRGTIGGNNINASRSTSNGGSERTAENNLESGVYRTLKNPVQKAKSY